MHSTKGGDDEGKGSNDTRLRIPKEANVRVERKKILHLQCP